jgi:DNA-binding CsgD family transcriptional regulator
MNDVFSPSFYNFVSVFALILSIVTLVISSIYILRKSKVVQNFGVESISKNEMDLNQYSEKLQKKDRQISDLQIKLDLKKSFEDDLIKTITEVESIENFDSKMIINELKTKLQNLNEIDKKQLTKKSTVFDDRGLFQKELENLHPELSYQERLLCSYFRLHLSSKEISVIEGITNGTVRVYKNKIKKKIGLTQDESLNEYLCNLLAQKVS